MGKEGEEKRGGEEVLLLPPVSARHALCVGVFGHVGERRKGEWGSV